MVRRFLVSVALFLAVLLLVAPAVSQTVVSRTRAGNSPEGSAYVTSGSLAGSVVVLDGVDVFAFSLRSPHIPARRLFDLKPLPIVGHPNGVAFVPGEDSLVFTEGRSPATLFFTDVRGRSRGTVTVSYLGGWMPNAIEGIAYIPPGGHPYADHFVTAAAVSTTGDGRLEVINRSGAVVHEIIPPPEWQGGFGGVEYLPNGNLLVGWENWLLEIDFDGNVVSQHETNLPCWFEGITRVSDSTFVAVGCAAGQLMFLDGSLTPTPERDRDYLFPPGIYGARSLTWDTANNGFLFSLNSAPVTGFFQPGVWALPWRPTSATHLFDLTTPSSTWYGGVAFMSDENRMAISHRHRVPVSGPIVEPPHLDIEIWDPTAGQLVETIWAAGPFLNMSSVPGAITYIPTTQQFITRAVGTGGVADSSKLQVLSRTGAFVRYINLAGVNGFGGLAYFNNGAGDRLLIYLPNYTLGVFTLDGELLYQFNYREKLDVIFPTGLAWISSGPFAGNFALYDKTEVVVFRLPH